MLVSPREIVVPTGRPMPAPMPDANDQHLILSGVRHVVNASQHVHVNYDKAKEFAEMLNVEELSHWLKRAPYDFSKLDDDQKLGFLFVFNSLSFSYWGSPKWAVGYNGRLYDGTWGLIISLGKAVKEGKSILDPAYLSGVERTELETVLRGNVRIPLFEERLRMLRELGDVTAKKFGGKFRNVVVAAKGDAIKLLNIILENYPSFNDNSIYGEKTVHFHKRAQLLVSDIYHLFEGKGVGKLRNIDKLTACADYKVPMVLREHGVLEYSQELAQKIDSGLEIPKGSAEEVEIRANTIHAVELIRDLAKLKSPGVTAMAINDHLWCAGQQKPQNGRQYHRTRTTSY